MTACVCMCVLICVHFTFIKIVQATGNHVFLSVLKGKQMASELLKSVSRLALESEPYLSSREE